MGKHQRALLILKCQFVLTTVTCYINKENDLKELDNVREQVRFAEYLRKLDKCNSLGCISVPCGINYQRCREMGSIYKRLMDQEKIGCITSHHQFSVVCLNKSILYVRSTDDNN